VNIAVNDGTDHVSLVQQHADLWQLSVLVVDELELWGARTSQYATVVCELMC